MRLYRLAPAIALFLVLACNRDAAVSTKGSVRNDPSETAGTTVGDKLLFLPTWSQQLTVLGYLANNASFVDVQFGGPILHVTEGNTRRSVLVRDPSGKHTGILVVRGADAAQFMAAFPPADFPDASCMGSTCSTSLDRVGLRMTAVNTGPALNSFDKTHPSFEKPVQHLKRFIAALHDDVDDQVPPANSPVLAYMQLENGEFTADTYQCDAKFYGEPDADFRPFGATSTLRLVFPQGALLHARTPKSGGWKTIKLTGTHIPIIIANVSAYPDMSHFHLLAKLSKDPNQTLPDVIERPGCIKTYGGVPGCGNNQWP